MGVARDLKLVSWIPHSLRRLGRDIDNTDISIPLYLDFEMATIRHFPNNRKFIYPDAHLRDPPPSGDESDASYGSGSPRERGPQEWVPSRFP